MRNWRLLDRIRRGDVQNVAFGEFVALAPLNVALGFRLERVRGSHRIYRHPDVPRPVSLQPARGKAKPYQVRQLLRLLEEYNLLGEVDR